MHPCPPDGSAFQPYVNDNHPPLLGFQITKLLVLVEKIIFKLSIMGILSNIYIYIFLKTTLAHQKVGKHYTVILHYAFMIKHMSLHMNTSFKIHLAQ